jgi:antitoxin component of MazEF toxin-antitoxin module
MTTLMVERLGQELVIRLSAEAQSTLDLREGDAVALSRSVDGEIFVTPADIDHRMRLGRGRAFLRRFRES